MGPAAFSGRLAAGKLHGKVHEVEKDNAGVEAGHSVERAGEKTFSISSRMTRTAIRNHRMKPYREAQKAEQALHKEVQTDKPSVLGQLSQAKKECAERKPPETGKLGKEEPEL